MEKNKAWLIRGLAVLGLLIYITLFISQYQTHGLDAVLTRRLPQMILVVAALFAMLIKTFLPSNGTKISKAEIQAGFDHAVQSFRAEDARAKKIFYRGYAASCENKYRPSDFWYKRALKAAKSPSARAEILSFLGMNALEQGKYTEAQQILEESAATDRTCVGAWCKLSDVYAARRDVAGAMQIAERGLGFCPQSVALLSRTGDCAFRLENYETALRDFKMAQRLDPTSAVLAGNVAVAYAGLGDAQNAYAEAAHAQALGHKNYDAVLGKIASLLRVYEARKVHYTGAFTLETAEGDFKEDCNEAQLYAALQAVFREESEFLILTPPAPIQDVLFMQAAKSDDGSIYVEVAVGEDCRFREAYHCVCSESETARMFMALLTEQRLPEFSRFSKTERGYTDGD